MHALGKMYSEDIDTVNKQHFSAALFLTGSLCAVSTLSITSKTAEEDVSHTYTFDNHGNVVSQIPSHLGQGK